MTGERTVSVGFMRMLASPRLLCLTCARDLSVKAAKFHRLRCKARAATRSVVEGEEQPEMLRFPPYLKR